MQPPLKTRFCLALRIPQPQEPARRSRDPNYPIPIGVHLRGCPLGGAASFRTPICLAAALLALPSAAIAQRARPRPAATAASSGPLPTRQPPATVIATVNGDPITVGDYADELAYKWGPAAFDMLQEDILVRQEAKRRKIAAGEPEVKQAVEDIVQDNARRVGGMAALQSALKERGWTLADFRAQARPEATIQALRRKIGAQLDAEIKITDAQVEAEYNRRAAEFHLPDEVEISHILIARPAAGDAAAIEKARAHAQAALDRIRAAGGANFAPVAAEVSEDKATAKAGGKVTVPIRRDAQPFGMAFDVAFTGPAGLFPQVLESSAGFHIVRIDRVIPAHVVPLSEAKEPLRRELFHRQSQARQEAFWTQRRKDARVERRLKY